MRRDLRKLRLFSHDPRVATKYARARGRGGNEERVSDNGMREEIHCASRLLVNLRRLAARGLFAARFRNIRWMSVEGARQLDRDNLGKRARCR